MKLLRKICDTTIIKFGFVGVLNTLSGLSIIYFCKLLLNLGDIVSNFIGYAVGLCISFYLNSKWTFKYKGMRFLLAIKFGIVILVAYGINIVLVMTLINQFSIEGNFAQPFGVIPYTVFCYMGCRFWVFKGAEGLKIKKVRYEKK